MSAWVKQEIDLGTHIMFIAQLVDAEVLSEKPTVTYDFYQKNIKPAPQKTEKKGWRCKICGYIYEEEVLPRLSRLQKMKHCFVFIPEWVYNGDGGIASINFGREMGQHCIVNSMHTNLKLDDGTFLDKRLPRGVTGWLDELLN
jgi:rubredoxin